ncbi:MAG: N-acetylneuraminate synthase family protein [Candidatus Omnitrophota bacterium]
MIGKIKIGEGWVGTGQPVFIIAEAGINHNGEYQKAQDMVDAAAECGADAIKFQTHLPAQEMLKDGFSAGYVGKSLFTLLKDCQLSEEEHWRLQERAKKKNIIFLSTPFSREAADFLLTMGIPAFKTGSGELTNIPLLEHIARKNKPMIISTGMSTLAEVARAVTAVRKYNKRIMLMQCTSTYPTEYKDVNLGAMKLLQQRFRLPVGLSDHSWGIYTALGAAALGAAAIEKHFTLDRDWPGPDQKASIVPAELKELVIGARAIKSALGSKKDVIKEEVPVRKMANESVVSLIDIQPGDEFDYNNIWVKRPGTGIPAAQMHKVLNRRARRFIHRDSLIKWSDIQ